MTPDATYAVEVNEAKIWATGTTVGREWWNTWRARFEPAGRLTIVTPSPGGDLVHVEVDNREHADDLVEIFNERAPRCARRVKVSTR